MTPTLESTAHRLVQRFVTNEAWLLDHEHWDQWRALFTSDGVYWMPADRAQASAMDHVSLIYDDAVLRELRCRRFRERRESGPLSLQPTTRSMRCITNLEVSELGAPDALAARANVVLAQYTRPNVQPFFAHVQWNLRIEAEHLWIHQKRVDLLNSDGPLSDILVYV